MTLIQTRKMVFNKKSSSLNPFAFTHDRFLSTFFFGLKQTYGTGLGLGDQIAPRDGRSDSTLLNGRGLLETVRVNTTKKGFGELHTVEGLNNLVPVGVDVGIGQSANITALSGGIVWGGVTVNTNIEAKLASGKNRENRISSLSHFHSPNDANSSMLSMILSSRDTRAIWI